MQQCFENRLEVEPEGPLSNGSIDLKFKLFELR